MIARAHPTDEVENEHRAAVCGVAVTNDAVGAPMAEMPDRPPTERGGPTGRLMPRLRAAAGFVLGESPGAALPERVRRVIASHDERSEILVCVMQVIAIGFFASLYAMTPKAFPPEVPFEPVPWTLSAYGLFTVLRCWLAVRRRLGRWFLRLSVVVDIVVLMLTIWSFHLQYQVAPVIYLKAPTLMYVFILIALRAMRLEAELVLLTGASAALGWLVLVLYAYSADPAVVTHSFVAYASSSALLIGAEMDRIISILMVAVVLAVALHRARGLLITAAREGEAANELARYFAPEVASQIRDIEAALPGHGVLRPAAILVTDLRDFTAGTRALSAKEMMEIITDYHALVVPIVQRHGGRIDKYLGDGVLASFGAVAPCPTFARDALAAALKIVRQAETWRRRRSATGRPAFEIVVAVTCGDVLVGPIGHATRLEYTVMGEPVNVAAKLEKQTRVEGSTALTTRATLEIAVRQGFRAARPLEIRSQRQVPGLGAPTDLVVLDSALAAAEAREPSGSAGSGAHPGRASIWSSAP